jgi:hypothetical protein
MDRRALAALRGAPRSGGSVGAAEEPVQSWQIAAIAGAGLLAGASLVLFAGKRPHSPEPSADGEPISVRAPEGTSLPAGNVRPEYVARLEAWKAKRGAPSMPEGSLGSTSLLSDTDVY